MTALSHFRELNDALRYWERYQSVTLEQLNADRDKRNMVLHAMLVSIQAAIDIASHLIAERGLNKPSTYREGFEILGQAGLIPEELAGELSDLAGFRNVPVHVYWGPEPGRGSPDPAGGSVDLAIIPGRSVGIAAPIAQKSAVFLVVDHHSDFVQPGRVNSPTSCYRLSHSARQKVYIEH